MVIYKKLDWSGQIFFTVVAVVCLGVGGLLAWVAVVEQREISSLRERGVRVSADILGDVTWRREIKRDGKTAFMRYDFTVAYADASGNTFQKSMSVKGDVFTPRIYGYKMYAPDSVEVAYLPENPGACRLARALENGNGNQGMMPVMLSLLAGGAGRMAWVVWSFIRARKAR